MKSPLILALAFLLAACGGASVDVEPKSDGVITGVSYVGVSVDDIDTAANFYEAAFEVERLGEEVLSLIHI